MAIEKELFVPFISANLGTSLGEVEKQAEKLEKFQPTVKVRSSPCVWLFASSVLLAHQIQKIFLRFLES